MLTLQKEKTASFIGLFASLSTLLCCGLPTLFVGIGLGAVVASAVSSFPFLVTLSGYKAWVFLLAGLILLLNFFVLYRKISPAFPHQGTACPRQRHEGGVRAVYWISCGLYGLGLFFAYLILPTLKLFGE